MKYINPNQKYSSKNTSINKEKLPAIFNKINWIKLKANYSKNGTFKVLDYGAGKYTDHIAKFLARFGIEYFPFDPYNCSDKENDIATNTQVNAIVCSNVLNVIAEDRIVFDIHMKFLTSLIPYFITIWDGDKSNVGGPTTCGYQRNQKIREYLLSENEVIKHEVITSKDYKQYII